MHSEYDARWKTHKWHTGLLKSSYTIEEIMPKPLENNETHNLNNFRIIKKLYTYIFSLFLYFYIIIMNYKSLLLILLIVVLVVVLAYNRKELFQSETVFCDGENDVKYVIFYPKSAEKVRANAKAIACNVKQYDSNTGMFVFRSSEMSNIAVEMGQPFELNLMCKIKGNGPVFTGNKWKVVAASDKIILQVENQAFQIPRSSSESSIELSYDSFSNNLVMFRLDGDDSTVKEVNAETALNFSRFDIGKADSSYFNGNIGNIVVLDSKLKKGETPATTQATVSATQDTGNNTSNDTQDKKFAALLQFLVNLQTFTNYADYSNDNNVEHFQANMQQPIKL